MICVLSMVDLVLTYPQDFLKPVFGLDLLYWLGSNQGSPQTKGPTPLKRSIITWNKGLHKRGASAPPGRGYGQDTAETRTRPPQEQPLDWRNLGPLNDNKTFCFPKDHLIIDAQLTRPPAGSVVQRTTSTWHGSGE